MRKRRRLADKLTIMVCAVLVAVSAFFYAPMDVSAQESLNLLEEVLVDDLSIVTDDISKDFDFDVQGYSNYYGSFSQDVGLIDFSSFYSGSLSPDSLYRVEYDLNLVCDGISSDSPYNALSALCLYPKYDINGNLNTSFVYTDVLFATGNTDFGGVINYSSRNVIYLNYDNLSREYKLHGYYFGAYSSDVSFDLNISFNNIIVSKVSSSDSEDYQNGYNAGYSAGEQVGYGNGYSQGFADGEASVDTNEIYNQGFNAGKESVDTQSYYDAGYQAGYQVAYQEGFDSGYDEGYQSAMDRIDGWGADTADYPLLLLDKPLMSRVFDVTVKSSIPTQYSDFGEWTTDLIYNPNHTYRFNVVLNPTQYKEGSADIYFLNEDIFYLNVGGIKYRISNFSSAYVNTFFVPGDRMSTAFGFSWEPLLAVMGDTSESGSAYCYYDLNYQIYDMGPSGDTQNHIANQTDQLTGGYNDSQGNSINNDFSSGLNEFETAEDSLFATATTGLKDFTFFDIQSVPAMVTGMSFVGSIMSGWFSQAGGASGVGIVLSILFSIMLVAMVLGLYRWYQSKGGKD